MAYVTLNLGYDLSAGITYSGRTDSSADWSLVPNDSFFYDIDTKIAYYKDGNGMINSPYNLSVENYTFASTQWGKTVVTPVTLPTGQLANGFTFFDNVTNKDLAGTTAYNEYNISYGRSVILSGTSGTANILVDGVNYLATFNVSLFQTALDWVNANKTTLNALGVSVFALGSGADGRIRFGSLTNTILNLINTTNVSGTLNGTEQNEFTGSPSAQYDHLVIPYVGEVYEGYRLNHNFRVNFNVQTGSDQTYALELRRYGTETSIGSPIQVRRNTDVSGNQFTIVSYTANALDPFVTGGFYFALNNQSGTDAVFIERVGILIQTYYQKPVNFV